MRQLEGQIRQLTSNVALVFSEYQLDELTNLLKKMYIKTILLRYTYLIIVIINMIILIKKTFRKA